MREHIKKQMLPARKSMQKGIKHDQGGSNEHKFELNASSSTNISHEVVCNNHQSE